MSIEQYFAQRYELEIKPVLDSVFKDSFSTHPIHYTLSTGKNKFRAVLPLVISEMTSFDLEKAKIIGAVAEIAWTGIIIHDDIIDSDSERRGQTAAHIQFSMNSALCSGVAAICAGSSILKENGLENEIAPYMKAVERTYLGQIEHQEIHKKSNVDDLFRIYSLKTSMGDWVLRACAVDTKLKDKLRNIENNLGIAGQIKDDFDDLLTTSDYEMSMRDMREGIINLPFLLFYKYADRKSRNIFSTYFGKKGRNIPRDEIITLLRNLEIFGRCVAFSNERINAAKDILNNLPKGESKKILDKWIDSFSIEHYLEEKWK